MFLPDRSSRANAPVLKEQYGDKLRSAAVYAPTDLINPYSALSVPHRCSKPELPSDLRPSFWRWTQDGKLQPEVANKVKEWFSVRTNPDGSTPKAWATGTSAGRAVLGIP
jgi:methionyl-tRNA synthetase